MADKERNALIPLSAGGLENIGSGPKKHSVRHGG